MKRLERLLRPTSIAVVGGGAFGTSVVEQCLKMGFAGALWPAHPSKNEIGGVRAYSSIAELPGRPDAVFVGVNRHLTVDIVRQLRVHGAGGAVCFAAGFLETGAEDAQGASLQRALVEAAGDMPILGPNCYGLINYADGALLWPDQHGGRRLDAGATGVAIVTQSSNIAINLTMQQRGLPIAYLLTAGNQAQIGISEMGLGLIEDPRVSALGLHIEGFDSVTGFEALALRARELRKPIVAMKVGRSEQARAATVSHTASLAGSDVASDAFLKRLGIARVETIPSFIEALKLLHGVGALTGARLSSLSCSGGEASVLADSAQNRRVTFPAIEPDHHGRLREALGPLVAIANPLDYNTFIWNDEPALTLAFAAMASGGYDLNLLVLDFPRSDRCSDAAWWPQVNAFETALKVNGAKGALVATMAENLSEDIALDLLRRGIVPLHGISEAMEAVEAALAIGTAWGSAAPRPLAAAPSVHPAARVSELSEASAKTWLIEAGLDVPRGGTCASRQEAVAAAVALGFPVVLKAAGLSHKSESGAVVLNLRSKAALREAADRLIGLGSGLYVERMVQGGVAELIVGVTRDPLFGPVMTIGSGGVLVELLQDAATLLLPVARDEIEAALRSLKLFPLLDGYRGRPKADLDAVVTAISRIAAFACAHRARIEEMDINPLIACGEGGGAWVADALIVERSETRP